MMGLSHALMKIVVFLFSLLLPGFVPPIVVKQTQECNAAFAAAS